MTSNLISRTDACSFTHSATRPLGAWLCLVSLLNVLLCTTGGFGGDINYWKDWTTQLQTGGYAQLDANYPPVYVHWLWLVAQFDAALKLPVATDLLMRFLTNSPILFAHMGLLLTLDRILASSPETSDQRWNLVIGFAALNPAILMNGPVWGQVDLLFSLILVWALLLLIKGRGLLWVFPLLMIAVLTKFQSICIAPVLLPVLWHRRCKSLWLGLLPAALIAVLLLLPYLLAGSTRSMLDLTYLKAASLYPYATYNANNLWYLLGLNSHPDSVFIFNFLNPVEAWQKLFTPKLLGMLLCSLWGLFILFSSWRKNENELHWRNAILAALGFFLFLPAMHERYMMPAVILAIAASAQYSRFNFHAAALSILSAANMILVLHPTGGLLSYLFSALTVIFAGIAWLTPHTAARALAWIGSQSFKRWLGLALLIWATALLVHVVRVMPKTDSWIDITKLTPLSSEQAWGDLRIGGSVSNNPLTVNKQKFARGFGTHAASRITIPIPANAETFTALVGVDDESPDAELEFIVALDGQQVWKSGRMKHGDTARPANIKVKGGHRLELITDPLGPNTSDHADWLEPRFLLAR